MFPAINTSLAFPERRVLRVDLYPRVTIVGCGQQFAPDCLFDGRVDSDGVPLPDFITSARRELMVLASFLDFLTGAIVANSRVLVLSVVFDWYAPAKLV